MLNYLITQLTMRRFIYTLIVSLMSFSLLGGVSNIENNPQYPPTRKKFATPVGFNYKKLKRKHKKVYLLHKLFNRKGCNGAL